MGLVTLPGHGLSIDTGMGAYGGTGYTGPAATLAALNANFGVVGRLRLQDPSSGPKVLSSAGGSISWLPWASVVFANASTRLRVGIQDVTSAGIPDGTFDVYKEYVGGTDVIASTTYQTASMGVGTKTMNDGDIISVALSMTARGGTDSVSIGYHSSTIQYSNNSYGGYPYIVSGSGSWFKSGHVGAMFAITFDDGTIGWIDQAMFIPALPYGTDGADFNLNSTPDEWGFVFKLKFTCRSYGFYTRLLNINTNDAFQYTLYSDPEGTPVAEQTVTANHQHFRIGGGVSSLYWTTPVTLLKDTLYCISIRPTTVNSVAVTYINLGVGNSRFKKAFPFDPFKISTRTNQTGAFTEIQDYHAPILGLFVDQVHDGAASGGGNFTFG